MFVPNSSPRLRPYPPRPHPTNPQLHSSPPRHLLQRTAPKPEGEGGREGGAAKRKGKKMGGAEASPSKSEDPPASPEICAYKIRPTPHSPTSCSPPRAAATTTKPIAGFVQSLSCFTAPDLIRGAASSLRLVAALLLPLAVQSSPAHGSVFSFDYFSSVGGELFWGLLLSCSVEWKWNADGDHCEAVDDGAPGAGDAAPAAVELQPRPRGAALPHAQRLLLPPRRRRRGAGGGVLRRRADAARAGRGARAVLPDGGPPRAGRGREGRDRLQWRGSALRRGRRARRLRRRLR